MILDWYDPLSPTAFVHSLRHHYDQWGNVVQIFDPLWGTAPGHYRDIVYDTVFQTFPVSETIDTGGSVLTVQASYDAGLGVMTQSIDFNQHRNSQALLNPATAYSSRLSVTITTWLKR